MSLSEALLTTAIDTMFVYTPKRYRQLQAKNLPKVSTWWLERDSNRRSSGRKASALPMRYHAPQDAHLYENSYLSTSSSPTAMEMATPVDRRGRFPWATGQGSFCSSPSKSVRAMSHLCTGCRNLNSPTNTHFTCDTRNVDRHNWKGLL